MFMLFNTEKDVFSWTLQCEIKEVGYLTFLFFVLILCTFVLVLIKSNRFVEISD